jgi:hypothetical protein
MEIPRLVDAIDDLHQGGLPGPVLSAEHEDRSLAGGQADAVQGQDTRERLADGLDLKLV